MAFEGSEYSSNEVDGDDCYPAFETTEIFPNKDAAYAYLQETALRVGFELVQDSHKTNTGGPRRIYCICKRGRSDKDKEVDSISSVVVRRSNTSTSSCGCPFKIVMVESFKDEGWIVRPCSGPRRRRHNHPFTVYAVGRRQSSKLPAEAKQLIRQMTDAETAPKNINVALSTKYPNLNQNIRQVYNEISSYGRDRRGGLNSAENCLRLAVSNGYLTDHLVTPVTGCLTHLFLAHPDAVEAFRSYPWVVGIDSTYKTNRYDMPLIEIVGMSPCNLNFLIAYAIVIEETADTYDWVLKALRRLIVGGVYPNVIVTDRELGLIRPIQVVFPESRHLLCTWHINKDVEARVTKLTNSKKIGASFQHGAWKRVTCASTVAGYETALADLKASWSSRQDVINYVEKTWLNPHRAKFVEAWTNDVLHFGNTTTCRVESSHSSLKTWLGTSTGSLDTIFRRIDWNIKSQLTKIKDSLEDSRSLIGRLHRVALFQNLVNKVSHHCLDKLTVENTRRASLGAQVYAYCGCTLRTTFGIPCACVMQRAIDQGLVLYLDNIHPFFKTLVMGDDGVDETELVTRDAQDQASLNERLEELARTDPSIRRRVASYIEDLLHPEESGVHEPNHVTNTRGRPSEQIPRSKSTKRNASLFEHVNRQHMSSSRGRTSKSPGRGSKGQSKQQATFPYPLHVPHIILPFIDNWTDVLPDGNCGFRCVADAFQRDGEDDWAGARRTIFNELGANWEDYTGIYGGREGIAAARKRIKHTQGPAGEQHWFEVSPDMFPVATYYNTAVVLYRVGENGGLWDCCTVLPLRDVEGNGGTSRELHIVFIEGASHFVRLQLKPNCPMPPLIDDWTVYRKPDVVGWEAPYARRMAAWNRVYGQN